jgi:uncharacterized protein YbaA (DUF1428 family)
MSYIEGFVTPVPTAHRDQYLRLAAEVAPIIREFGARRMVETWGDEVPAGEVTDFQGAVRATADETVVFSWFEYPSREAREEANRRLREDPRLDDLSATMPFDGKRMINGGFTTLIDEGTGGTAGYVDGYIVAVPEANREAYRVVAAEAAGHFLELGALRAVEAWGDDVPDGKVTDFRRAVKAQPGEAVIFSWVEWPSKETRNAGWKRFMEENPMTREMPFDGKRLVYGGFVPVLDA